MGCLSMDARPDLTRSPDLRELAFFLKVIESVPVILSNLLNGALVKQLWLTLQNGKGDSKLEKTLLFIFYSILS